MLLSQLRLFDDVTRQQKDKAAIVSSVTSEGEYDEK